MNKLVKAGIAATIGTTLLVGGAGTFALWNAGLPGMSNQTVTAGNLALTAGGAGAWTNGSTPITDVSSYRIVPGDTLTYTQTLNVTAIGNDLHATLGYTGLSESGTNGLDSLVTPNLTVTSPSSNLTTTGSTIEVTGANAPATVQVTLTLAFDKNAATGQNGTVNLSGLNFTLQQHA